jgi:hypothetical protein
VLKVSLISTCAGVLPGLEEGSDHYQRTSSLLEAVVEAVNPFVFYSALWECVAANATVRRVEAFKQFCLSGTISLDPTIKLVKVPK